MATDTLTIGSPMPVVAGLKGTDGITHALGDFKTNAPFVVVFSCNHCPYVKGYEDRMIGFQKDFQSKGVQLVAINSNETQNYPEDDFDEMVRRAKDKGFNFPYLRDEDQSAAAAFGATHTPEFFLFDKDRTLRYHGRFDDNHQDPEAVSVHYLRDAVEALLAGKNPPVPETHSIGCTIKWKY